MKSGIIIHIECWSCFWRWCLAFV